MPSSDSSKPGSNRKQTQGRKYENLAAEYYQQQNFDIIERNWRAGHKEIDLIVKRGNLIVFVEVKSTYSKKFGHPAERVDKKKISNLTQAAKQYLIRNSIENTDLRFDVVTFVNGQLEHFPDAFPAE
ncbi:MAG: YraN family protein [Candidatus Zixiibacteriota bacterium]|nr:MAG: YraN family protein [candidate division Zixibacteria bacterium]